MKHLLITGSRGKLGSELISLLRKKNKVFGIDLIEPTHKDDFKVNSLNDEFLINFYEKASTIIHCAALSSVSSGENNPMKCISTNINEICYLLNKLKVKQKKTIIISSADSLNITKNESNNIYSISKYSAELISKYFSKKYSIPLRILRFTTLYGFSSYYGNKVLPLMIQQALENKTITINTNDTFNFIHYIDAINGIEQGVNNFDKNEIFKDYNLFSNENINLTDLAEKIILISKSKSKVLIKGKEYKFQNIYNFGSKLVGWKNNINLENGIKKTILNIKNSKMES